MKKALIPTVLLITLSVLFYSCGKHVYALNEKELSKLMAKAKEPGDQIFVQYSSGETLRGQSIKWKYVKGNDVLMLDGKQVTQGTISSYQDKYAYYLVSGDTEYPRVYNGKARLYLHQTDGRKINQTYNPNTNSTRVTQTGSITTTFYIGKGSSIERCTHSSVENHVKDYEPALAQFKKEFPNGRGYMNDYRALVRILEVYNQKP
jgi:hypothetical protein